MSSYPIYVYTTFSYRRHWGRNMNRLTVIAVGILVLIGTANSVDPCKVSVHTYIATQRKRDIMITYEECRKLPSALKPYSIKDVEKPTYVFCCYFCV